MPPACECAVGRLLGVGPWLYACVIRRCPIDWNMPPFIDLSGQRFGRLVAASRDPNPGLVRWICRCDCGTTKSIGAAALRHHGATSCGCYQLECRLRGPNHTHGLSRTREYKAWKHAKGRCFTPTNQSYDRYGARGITMAKAWADSFELFYAELGPRPAGTSLDRIDNSKGYEPGNCRWATKKEQASNTRRNIIIERDGRTWILKDLLDHLGLGDKYSLVRHHLGNGRTFDDAITPKRPSSYGVRRPRRPVQPPLASALTCQPNPEAR
jgi:hypothetical protein